MKSNHRIYLGLAAVFGLLSTNALATTDAASTPTPLPLHFYQASVFLTPNVAVATGTGGAGALAITSLTFANQGGTPVQVDMFQATTTGGSCAGTITQIGGSPDIFVIVPAMGTLHLDYPTPLVISHLDGQSCIGFSAVSGLSTGNTIGVLVNGFKN